MKKEYRICKNYEFSSIIHKQNFVKSSSFVCYIESKKEEHNRIGISVSKKLGNAVTRNKLKRQIKSIIDQKHYENSFNCIIILRKGILTKNFQQKQDSLFNALKILNIIKEDFSEKE